MIFLAIKSLFILFKTQVDMKSESGNVSARAAEHHASNTNCGKTTHKICCLINALDEDGEPTVGGIAGLLAANQRA